jgi:hypothetical protein
MPEIRPAIVAGTTCSIFIASRVATGWPAVTASSSATWIAITEPGIGATT